MPVSGKAGGAGFRRGMVYELDPITALPKPPAVASETEPETYLAFVCSKTFTPTMPDPQIITHTGDDGVCGSIMLPPNESIVGELTTGVTNLDVDALLQNINVVTHGDQKTIGRGQTPQEYALTGFLFYRVSVDSDPESPTKGADRYNYLQIPKCKSAPQGSPYEEGGDDVNTYSLMPQSTKNYLWGMLFTDPIEGFIQTQMITGIAVGVPTLNTFLLPTTPSLSLTLNTTAKADLGGTSFAIKVYHWVAADGSVVDVTSEATFPDGDTVDVSAVTATPVEDDIIYVWYEEAV